eukprot:3774172-Rhodomonas_salina.5
MVNHSVVWSISDCGPIAVRLRRVPLQLTALSSLLMLSLADNKITSLPSKLFLHLPRLKSLSLQGNPLTTLPLTLGGLTALEFLNFDSAHLSSPPRDIVVKSVHAVLLYLRRAWAGRIKGCLDLSECDLTEVPLQVTGWSPALPPSIDEDQDGVEMLDAEDDDGVRDVLDESEEEESTEQYKEVTVMGGGGEKEYFIVDDDEGRTERAQERLAGAVAVGFLEGEAGGVEDGRYVDMETDKSFDEEDDIGPSIPSAPDILRVQEEGEAEEEEEDDEELREEWWLATGGPWADKGQRGWGLPGDDREWDEVHGETEEEEGGVSGDWMDGEASGTFTLHKEELESLGDADADCEGIQSLWSLDLRRNGLGSLRDEIGMMANLRVLLLCDNTLRELPSVLGQLSQLRRLSASNNLITTLPPDLGGLHGSLTLLDLSHNKLASLPSALPSLSALESLCLDDNAIKVNAPLC